MHSPSELDELDALLEGALTARMRLWAREQSLPELVWSIIHWDGYLTIRGVSPSQNPAERTAHYDAWRSTLGLRPSWNPYDESPLYIEQSDWHIEIG